MIEDFIYQDWAWSFPLEFAMGAGVAIVIYFLWTTNMQLRIRGFRLLPLIVALIMAAVTYAVGWFL